MKFLNVYEIGQAYGGPEEGGWWYTSGNPVESQGFADEELKKIEAMRDALNAKFRNEKSSYSMGMGEHDGVDFEGFGDDTFLLTGGVWGELKLRAKIENHAAKYWPEERPYYC